MRKSGAAYLPLHSGKAPPWLFNKMVKLGRSIITLIIDDYGEDEFLRRVSDPYWFQALGCTLGFDWHSSGVTTVLTGVLEKILSEEDLGVYLVGGKGSKARGIPSKLMNNYADKIGYSKAEDLVKASKLSAKIDTVLLQDGYELYHHSILFSRQGKWAVVQQGMNPEVRYARRYHLVDDNVYRGYQYIEEPHEGIAGDRREEVVLDLTAESSRENKDTVLDIVREKSFRRDYEKVLKMDRNTLYRWIDKTSETSIEKTEILAMPRRINWSVMRKIYDIQPNSIPEFISIPGVTPKVVRAVSLVAELIYGAPASWKDPIKYTFTVGGKDAVPFPVDKDTYDKIIRFFKEIVEGSEIDAKDKKASLKRLARLGRKI